MKICVEKVTEKKKSEGYRKNYSKQNHFWPDLIMLTCFGVVSNATKMY